ncbi:MAG TPA: sugar acetyltransferase [Firmicutes bacterium]|jgi:sugar O-acyltransferase (sialic acid O-acetyltransferase NeuD family)|nr:sugar acetyltransferase [Bacillota bacterium]
MNVPVILLGSGGHGRILLEMLQQQSITVLAVVDPRCPVARIPHNIRLLRDDKAVLDYPVGQIQLVNGLGSVGDTAKRQQIYEYFKTKGYQFMTTRHHGAIISPEVQMGEGVQVMAGVVIQIGTMIAANTIINTRAVVEHDCVIGKHVHIAPGAVLSGGVHVADSVHIGVGATIIQGVAIGKRTIIGAGAVVVHDIPENVVAVGVPARIIKSRERDGEG